MELLETKWNTYKIHLKQDLDLKLYNKYYKKLAHIKLVHFQVTSNLL